MSKIQTYQTTVNDNHIIHGNNQQLRKSGNGENISMSKKLNTVNNIQKKEKLTNEGVQIWDKFYVNISPGNYIITVQDRNGNPWVNKDTAIQVKKKILENESIVSDIREIIQKNPQSDEEKTIIKCLREILSENKNLDFNKTLGEN